MAVFHPDQPPTPDRAAVLAARRRWALQALEKRNQSRAITLIHRRESFSFLGIPFGGYIDIDDSEAVIRAIEMTAPSMPIDLVLHTPGGLVLAAEQIANALASHQGPVTVYVPHYAMSGGPLIALAANQIIMAPSAVLGPVDPQLGEYPAASILVATAQKDPNETDDKTLILADVARKAQVVARKAQVQVRDYVTELLRRQFDDQRATEVANALSEGRWTHDFPISADLARSFDLKVSTDLPDEIRLYPQPRTSARRSSTSRSPTRPPSEGNQAAVRSGPVADNDRTPWFDAVVSWAMDEPVIRVRGLRKSYGSIEAVRGIDLEIQAGEVFAFLGPNGAGKTTTVEILEGYRSRDAGEVSVLGHDPARPTRAWYAHIGVVLQTSQVQSELTVRETVDMHAGYYPAPRPVDETIEAVGLTEQSNQRAGKLSGGQQRRLDVGLALVGDPALLFLDEPTTGLDPGARRNAWALIANLRQLGKTIFLTTHYMDEAQELADRVAIIVGGRIVAEGPPDQLGRDAQQPRTRILFRLANHADLGRLPGELVRRARVDGDLVELPSDNPVADLHALTGWAVDHGADLLDLEVRRERLEDVYLQLTGEQ